MNLKKTKIEIEQFLKIPDTDIFFFDEGRFGLKSTLHRVWAKKGEKEKLEIKVKQGYKSTYIYSAVSPKTGDSFSLILPFVNTEIMSLYLEEFSKEYINKNIIIIMDQAGWHRSKELIIPENIKILLLPPYSPELNPVERFWKWIRFGITHNRVFDTLDNMIEAIELGFKNLTNEIFKNLCNCSYL
jgi:transposase